MGNVCRLCHRLKADNPSRFHWDCWVQFQKIEATERRDRTRSTASIKAADARGGSKGSIVREDTENETRSEN